MKLERLGLAALALAALASSGCDREETALAAVRPERPPLFAPAPRPEPPLEAREMPVPGDVPAFVVTGPGGAPPRMVFLHGMCGHGLGYIQSFQAAAREHGGVLALQGDISCGGEGVFRKYSFALEPTDARIREALAAVGGEARDLTLIGYSQGAYVAERLAARWPDRYARVVLLGAPTTPLLSRLRDVRGAVMISGEFDAKYRMKDGARTLAAAGIPATYLEMPDAHHGQMTEAERIMDEALDWLDANSRPAP